MRELWARRTWRSVWWRWLIKAIVMPLAVLTPLAVTPLFLAGTAEAALASSAKATASPCGSAGYNGPWGCVLLAGSAWAPSLAGLGDLNVYNNGTTNHYGPDAGYTSEYQCTELAVRYAAVVWHEGRSLAKPENAWYNAGWDGSAQDMWNVAANLPIPLTRIANGTSAPEFGDLIVFSETGGPGHVGVVVGVTDGRLYFVGENQYAAPAEAWIPINASNKASPGGDFSSTLQPVGWLRGPSPKRPDFSGSGRADLAWDQGGTLNLLTGQPNGTFDFGGATSGIYPATWEGAGNFQGGTKDDVASYSASTHTITLFSWSNSQWVVAGQTTGIGKPSWVAVGDFNGDGTADLAWDQGGTLYLLAGNPSGTFSLIGHTSGIYRATWEGAGTFQGGNKADVASYSASTQTITLFSWSNNQWVVAGQTAGIGAPNFAVAGGFSGSGRADLAWDQGGTLYLLTGQPNGTFGFGGSTSGIYPATWEGAGYFKGDSEAEVASYGASTQTITEFEWVSNQWVVAGQTAGIGSPAFAVVGD